MSRIHDALLKAEQERLASLRTNSASKAQHEEASPCSAGEPSNSAFQRPLNKFVQRQWKPDPRCVLFIDSHGNTRGEEEFRTLRSRLHQFRQSHTLRSLVIASALPGEGKTFVAVNLARALARQRGSRVLLIDADLRSPQLHLVLGAPVSPGLAEYLGGKVDLATILQGSYSDNLFYIPSGEQTPHAAELIVSGQMKTLLEHLASSFDWVIIDSPPVLPVSDASLLAQLADGVLWVIKTGYSRLDAVQKALRSFSSRPIVGTVLNGTDDKTAYGSYSLKRSRNETSAVLSGDR